MIESNSMSFSELGLAEPLVRALEAKGYSEPTPIQRDSIPTLLEGRDLLLSLIHISEPTRPY